MTLSTKLAVALAGVISVLPVAAFAQTPNDNNCYADSGLTTLKGATLAQIIAVGDCSIAFRDQSVTTAETRVSQLQKVSSSTQASLQSTLQATTNTLGTIKTSLDADTASSSALTDFHSIFGSVRVFALVLPRTWIYATSDREMTISADLQTVNAELITKNQTASTTAQTADAPLFADITTQLSTLNTQATNADSVVQPLMPDLGSSTTLASNTAALKSAKGMLVTGQTAIKAIVNDITQIRANLHV